MNYSKNKLIRYYPNPNSQDHYTAVALEDNGRVLQVKPKGGAFPNVRAWFDSLPKLWAVKLPTEPVSTNQAAPTSQTVSTTTQTENGRNPHEKVLLDNSNYLLNSIGGAVNALRHCCEHSRARLIYTPLMKESSRIAEETHHDLQQYTHTIHELIRLTAREYEYQRRIKNNTW